MPPMSWMPFITCSNPSLRLSMMPMEVRFSVIPLGTLMCRHPGRQRGRCRVRRLELPQRDADMRARKAGLADGDRRGVFTGGDGRRDALFQCDEARIAKAEQHLLERVMARGVERPLLPMPSRAGCAG